MRGASTAGMLILCAGTGGAGGGVIPLSHETVRNTAKIVITKLFVFIGFIIFPQINQRVMHRVTLTALSVPFAWLLLYFVSSG
jgi:hypothetical protein